MYWKAKTTTSQSLLNVPENGKQSSLTMVLSHEVNSIIKLQTITVLVEQSLSTAEGEQSICKVLNKSCSVFRLTQSKDPSLVW